MVASDVDEVVLNVFSSCNWARSLAEMPKAVHAELNITMEVPENFDP
jgi:hypothetical protein